MGTLEWVCVRWQCIYFACITNYHKLSSLKQEKFILPQFWEPVAQNLGIGRAMLLWNSRGECFHASSSFCWVRVFLGLWLHCSNLCLFLHVAFSVSVSYSFLSLIRAFVIELRTHPDNPEWSHLQILSLITSVKSLPKHSHIHRFLRLGYGSILLGGPQSTHYNPLDSKSDWSHPRGSCFQLHRHMPASKTLLDLCELPNIF